MFGNNKKYTFEYLLELVEKGKSAELNKIEIRREFLIHILSLNHIDFIFQVEIFTKMVKTLKKMPFSQGKINIIALKGILESIDYSLEIIKFHNNQYKYSVDKTIDELNKEKDEILAVFLEKYAKYFNSHFPDKKN